MAWFELACPFRPRRKWWVLFLFYFYLYHNLDILAHKYEAYLFNK
jgi:hypothetical protein